MSEVDLANPAASTGGIKIKNIVGNGMNPFIQGGDDREINCYEKVDIQRNSAYTMTINAVEGGRVMLTGVNLNYQAGLQKLMVDGVDMMADITGTSDTYQLDDTTSAWTAYSAIARLVSQGYFVGRTIEMHFFNASPTYVSTLCMSWSDVE
ncbi:hypothetical protein [Vibrio rotiferianus]|uniref:hypothetical protein n=1 Tax=Vibrio rotiferianus TaxID=190895 RepID=UPI000B59B656|nr:hypothetical protein [Vibrio rotiferianus]ASI93595.1 hypothetical protein BSZ04_00790 [Vibrio rotiferianus]